MKPYYERGGITIYHGDCREVLPKLGNADLVVTDPPYNAGKDYDGFSDAFPEYEYEEAMRVTVAECRRIAPCQAWVAPRYQMPLWWSLLPDAHEVVVFGKASNAIRQGWTSKFTVVLAVGKPVEGHPEDLWTDIRLKGEGYFFREETYGHPGYTPEPILRRCICLLSPEGGLVVDPFGGTGTTARAAKDLGRRCVMVEQSERYCEIAAKRLSQERLL